MKWSILLSFLLLSFASFAQPAKDRSYFRFYGPGEIKTLCATQIRFFDSVGFYSSGCEAHKRAIGAFRYTADSTGISCDFIDEDLFPLYSSLVKKKVEGQPGIKVMVFDIEGNKVYPAVSIVQVKRKKDKILKEYGGYSESTVIDQYRTKNTFWTLTALYPLFFPSFHFSFDPLYNYYEFHMNLPRDCLTVTEGKAWMEGKDVFKIIDSTHIKGFEGVLELERGFKF